MDSQLDVLVLEVERLAREGKSEQAMSLACDLVEQYSGDTKVWSLRAYLYSCQRHHGESIKDLTRAIEINGKEPKLFYDRGIEELALRNNQAAASDFTKGLELCDYYQNDYYRESMHFLRAEAFIGLGEKLQAIADLEHVRDDLKSWTYKLRTKSELLNECKNLPD